MHMDSLHTEHMDSLHVQRLGVVCMNMYMDRHQNALDVKVSTLNWHWGRVDNELTFSQDRHGLTYAKIDTGLPSANTRQP